MEFKDAAQRVVILEGGGLEFESDSQALYDVAVAGASYTGAREGRFRVAGGSTTRWGGQALRLERSDFQVRDWVPNSGWPLEYEAITPYYDRAARFLGVNDGKSDEALLAEFGITPPSFDPGAIKYHLSRWTTTPDLWKRYGTSIRAARNITLFLHANVTEAILDNEHARLSHVTALSLHGHRLSVRAQEVVICCGGLETPRLLLANRQQCSNGLGNDHGVVGRYLQDHAGAVVGTITPRDDAQIQHAFNLFHRNRIKYSIRCSAAAELQARERMLNASSSVMFIVDEDSAFAALKTAYRMVRSRSVSTDLWRLAARVVADPVTLALPIVSYVFRNRTYTPNARCRLALTVEQEPNPQSRVMLGRDVDQLGVPRLVVDWRLTDFTWLTVTRFLGILAREFEAVGVGSLVVDKWIAEKDAWRTKLVDHYHHIGTARMHVSPSKGVVDSECRVHGIANLSIASSAVFPTSGHSNPTLTILALSIRIADRLRQLR
ncbi:MAG: GMC oxidoreductase [Gemmatimonadaceae bacterium]